MNFAKRAWLNLIAKKGRTALLILVTSAIMLFVMAGLLIKSAANQATENAKDSIGATLTLSANREAAFKKMRENAASSDGQPSQPSEKPSLSMSPVKLSTAEKIAKLAGVESYSVAVSTSANAKSFDAISTSTGQMTGPMGNRGGESSGDITISGVSSTAANANFSDKTYVIKKGRGLTASDEGTNNVVIESELATENDLKVGDTITVKNTAKTKTYKLKVVGIYKAKSTASTTMGGGMMGGGDPSNTIFASYTFANTLKGTKYKDTADSVVFTVSTPSKVAGVKKAANKLISSKFSLTADDQSYQMVKASMSSVTSFADKIVWLVAIAGTIILALIVVLMIRERRFEIGILLSLGEKRAKVIAQFFVELFVILLVGVGIASAGGQFVGDKLAAQVVSSAQTTTTSSTNQPGGMPGGQGGPGGTQGASRTGAPSGMPGQASQKAQTKQAKLATQVTFKSVAILFGLGLAIILIAILAGAGGILRLNPKRILIG
ncbi:ABC transporter permease [Lacticaseibacillus kribbianus]|uniref:ABC transporter permease n=1 Tax=Lacticaseibacillus kribbianus TaxID=2926292 RepID=UPI001CD61C3E|nr:ABC transporter permease [Lacticaseibacillus kribbianus]